MTGLAFPDISPIMFSIGPVAVRWYSMAYLIGILAGWWLIRRNAEKYQTGLTPHAWGMQFFTAVGTCGRNPGIFWNCGKAACLFMAGFSA